MLKENLKDKMKHNVKLFLPPFILEVCPYLSLTFTSG